MAALDAFTAASKQAIKMTETSAQLPQLLREAVSERMQSSPLYGQREEAAKQVLTSGARGREQIADIVKGGTILSPTQQQSILAQQRASDVVPLLSLNDLLQAQTGGGEAAIQGGVDLFSNLLQAQQQKANLLKDLAQMEEERRQFNLKQSSGGGMGFRDRLALFNALKPSGAQESQAIQAQSGIQAVNVLRQLSGDDKAVYLGNRGFMGRLFGGKNARAFQDAAREAYDVFLRSRTGAALNLNEEQFYKQYIPTGIDDTTTRENKLNRLNSVFEADYQLGQNPLDVLFQGLEAVGGGGNEWELVF